jgi:Sugar phosphate isomerases/epimerases
MKVRLGINTCFAVKRWPLAADWIPIVRDRLGLTIVQHSFDLVPTGSTSEDAKALARSTSAAGLELHSTFTGLASYSDNLLLGPDPAGRAAAATWYRWAIEWTAAAGGIACGGHVGAFSVPDWTDPSRREALWVDLQAALLDLAGVASKAGLAYLMVENLAAAREPSTMTMIRDLLTNGDDGHVPIRLCLDVGHMCVPGTSGADRDPYAWLRDLGRAAPVIQLQQSDPDGDHHWPFTAERNAVGRIDADRVLDALGEGGIDETALVLEVIPAFEQDDDGVLDDLAASVDYWREALIRTGLA